MENNIARVSSRICAYLIDIFIVYIIISLIMEIKFINPYYDEYMETYDKYTETLDDYQNGDITADEYISLNEESYYYLSKYSVTYNVVIVLGIVLYFGVFQKYNDGQTIGKRLLKIKVVSENDEKLSLGKSILRVLPMYYIYIGSIVPLFINTILVYFIPKSYYMTITTVISSLFLVVAIISIVMIYKREDKKGIQDLIAMTKVINATKKED